MKKFDVVILGGGIMGVMSARALAKKGAKVAIVEQYRLFNPYSASGGKTRSFRNDYLDPLYGKLALDAGTAWQEFETAADTEMLIRCGCLNLWDPRLGIEWSESYAGKAARALQEINAECGVLDEKTLPKSFTCAKGTLDIGGGLLNLSAVNSSLQKEFRELNITLFEQSAIREIVAAKESVEVSTATERLYADRALISTGRWVAETLRLVRGAETPQFKLVLDRPISAVYCLPKKEEDFAPKNLPVFACLDIGVYGHPVLKGVTSGVKVGFFRPATVQQSLEGWSVERFLDAWMPELGSCARIPVSDTDLCSYDNTPDGDFIVGEVSPRLMIAAGFCGTGYKFAPLIGEMVAGLSGDGEYPVPNRFNPWRFSRSRAI